MEDSNSIYDDLLTGYFVGNLSNEEEEIFFKLLSEDETFRHRYDEMSKLYALSSISALKSQKEANYEQLKSRLSGLSNEKEAKTKQGIRLWSNNFRKIAAILIVSLLMCGGIGFYLYKNANNPQVAIFETVASNGSRTKISLPDGSTVWLNSESKLIYDSDFGKKDRRVSLEGEGHFEITKDDASPFYVRTKDIEVKVLGTIFNFDAYESKPCSNIVLQEGKIVVSIEGEKASQIILAPNQILIFNKQTRDVSVEDVHAGEYTAWIDGKLSFDNATFSEIVEKIGLKYNKVIVLKNDKLSHEVFSGNIDTDLSLEEAISTFDVEGKHSLVTKGDTLFIY